MGKPKNRFVSVYFFPVELKGAVVVRLHKPIFTFGGLKQAAGERLQLQPSSLSIFGIFLGPLSSPNHLCVETDIVPEGISSVCLRRLSFNEEEERRIINSDAAAMTLIFWEVKQEYDQRLIQPNLDRYETKILERELCKGWSVPLFGSRIFPAVNSMTEFLRYIRMKRSSYYWSYYHKADCCNVEYSESIFAGVLPGIGDGDGLVLHLALDKTGLIFLDVSGKELCHVPWCAIHCVRMDTGAKMFIFYVRAEDEYGLLHTVDIPVQTDRSDFLYSVALRMLSIQDKVIACIDPKKPRTLTIKEYKLLDSIRPRHVKFDQFMSWLLPVSFHNFLQLHTKQAKYQWLKYKHQLPPRQLHTNEDPPSRSPRKFPSSPSKSSNPILSVVSALEDPYQYQFALAYLTSLNNLDPLLQKYSQKNFSSHPTPNKCDCPPSSQPAAYELIRCSQDIPKRFAPVISNESLMDKPKWQPTEEPSLVHPSVVFEYKNKNCCEELTLFKLDFAKAQKLFEDKMKLCAISNTVTTIRNDPIEDKQPSETPCTKKKYLTDHTMTTGEDLAAGEQVDGKAGARGGTIVTIENARASDMNRLSLSDRVITVRAFGSRSYEVPLCGGRCTVGQFKQYVGRHCLNLKEASCRIFGIFLCPLGSPGAHFLDSITFPPGISDVSFQRMSFDLEVEHSVIKSDLAAVDLLYWEGKYMFDQGMVLPKPTEEDKVRLKQLIQSKNKMTFVKKMSGMHIGTQRFPEVSCLADYWWIFYHRAEFCTLQDCMPIKGRSLAVGTILHVALSRDLLTLLGMNDVVLAFWSIDCIQCVLMQNTDLHKYITFEIMQGKKEGEKCNNILRYLFLETPRNEYLFSMAEHLFQLHETSPAQAGEACDLSISRKCNESFYTTAYKFADDDPVFRVVNRSARGPLVEDDAPDYCEKHELHRILQALTKTVVKTNACKINTISLV